jgi:hypothetical protein
LNTQPGCSSKRARCNRNCGRDPALPAGEARERRRKLPV